MIEHFIESAWSCLNKLKSEKKPPDRPEDDEKPRDNSISTITIPSTIMDSISKRSNYLSLDPAAIPAQNELNEAFQKLLEELDLSPDKRKVMSEQSDEKKWMMVVEQSIRKEKAQQSATCANFVQVLEDCAKAFPDKYALPLAAQNLEALAISLRTESFSYVQRFLEQNGVEHLTTILHRSRNGGELIAIPILSCFKALLNSTAGRSCVLDSCDALLAIAGSLDFHNSRCKILSLEILSGLCVVPEGGHKAVLKALTEARTILGDRTRFQKIVEDLHREHGTARDTERVRIALMSLINALLKSGPAEHSLEFRLHLRYELLMLGIQEIIDRLRNSHGSALEDHFDLFEMMRQEDEQEFASSSDSGSNSPIDFESPAGMTEALTRKLDSSVALPHLISLLQHLLMIPGDERHRHLWRLFDIILQQLSLQSTMGNLASEADPQYSSSLNFDMDELLSRLRTQNEYEKLEKLLAETNAELEHERKRVMELENRLSDIQDGASLSSFSRISDLSNPSDPCHSPTPTIYSSSATSLPPVNPPAPPPPPPSAKQLRALGGPMPNAVQEPKKKIPKPPTTLKTLNWTKISAQKIPGTVWEKIEDEKFYKQIDLQSLATTFVAGNGHSDESEYGTSTLQRRLRHESSISVIEPRRAQNCTIMLSKLKLSHREIRAVVLSMDEKGRLPKDMIEQMLKFVPTKEEFALLREMVNKHKTPAVLALADRFLLEVGQIPRYEQRLRCLHIIRTFQERVDEITPYLNAVIKASNTAANNKKLRQLLALILAVGNYLNHGKRSGNAMGFTIGSLSVLPDVKSSLRHDRNLLHFIIELLEQKFPEIMSLKRELAAVYEAARYNRSEMAAELRSLEGTLRVLSSELQAQQKMASTSSSKENADASQAPPEPLPTPNSAQSPRKDLQKDDKFIAVVSSFLDSAKKQYHELERLNNEMNTAWTSCASYFAEDAQTCSPDEFFGVFSKFFNQFTECHHHLWEEREELERVKRQTLARSIFAKKSRHRNATSHNSGKDFERLINALQTGEFFSEDLSRLRTSFRVPKKEKSKS